MQSVMDEYREYQGVRVALLLAAGLGTRMLPFTQSRCKSVLPVLGIPVAAFPMVSLGANGVEKIVANIHHDPKRTIQSLKSVSLPKETRLEFSDESEVLLGSAGAWRKALPQLGSGPFFLANADVICDVDWNQLALTHFRLRRQWGVTLTLSVFKRPSIPGRYREIFLDQQKGLIRGLGEVGEHENFFSGAAVVELDALKNIPEGVGDFVSLILRPAVQHAQAGYHLSDGLWLDVGTPSSWLGAHRIFIESLETGKLKGPNGPLWRRLIESRNRRMGSNIWASQSSHKKLNTSQWRGPCYWENSTGTSIPPRVFGPESVLYGDLPKTSLPDDLSYGIGHDGLWVKNGK